MKSPVAGIHALSRIEEPEPKPSPVYGSQTTFNGEVHNWHRIILGFPDHLVGTLLDKLNLNSKHRVLDPFCGTGTTIVECMKRNISCVGIEANPACVFSARVKSTWDLRAERLLECLNELSSPYHKYMGRNVSYKIDPAYIYLNDTGMIDRGWISPRPLQKALALRLAIRDVRTTRPYKDALTLALLSELVNGASNVKFGPQLYCGPVRLDSDVMGGFRKRVEKIAKDLKIISELHCPTVKIIQGDSRSCARLIYGSSPVRRFDAVICSPPYPTEHDYTRHTRLELAFLEAVSDTETVRAIKQTMIRSHTKGIYKKDRDGEGLRGHHQIGPLVEEIEKRALPKTHGFARLYGRVVLEYFAGMKKHLNSVRGLLRPGAKCAYVLGDQASYLQVLIPTAEILSSLARDEGFDVLGIEKWRGRWSTTTSRIVDENILFLRRP